LGCFEGPFKSKARPINWAKRENTSIILILGCFEGPFKSKARPIKLGQKGKYPYNSILGGVLKAPLNTR